MRRRRSPSLTRRAVLGAATTTLLAGCNTPSPPPATDWPMFGYDAARTGVHPEASGPTAPVEVAWQQETRGDFLAAPVAANGTVYVGGNDGSFHAFDAVDGTRQWRFRGGGSAFNAPAAVGDGVVYAGNADHRLYALAADGGFAILEFNFGLTEWWTEFPASVVSAPAIHHDRCYLQTTDGSGYAVDRTSGKAQWRADSDGTLFTSPAVAGETMFLQGMGDRTMQLSAIDIHTGDRRWRLDHGTDRPPTRSTPAVRDGRVFVGSNDGQLYAVSTDGTRQWTYRPDGYIPSSPAVGPDRVYIAETTGTVLALDPVTGDRLWRTPFDIDPPVTPSAPAIADGVVYLGIGSQIRALETATGDRRWGFETGSHITGTPIALGDRVYVQSTDGTLYCLHETA
ncbi:MAG: PQQ-binding-like beta-propeller repeat protein [Halobacteriales archaeon]